LGRVGVDRRAGWGRVGSGWLVVPRSLIIYINSGPLLSLLLTLPELALISGVSRPTIAALETTNRRANPETTARLARAILTNLEGVVPVTSPKRRPTPAPAVCSTDVHVEGLTRFDVNHASIQLTAYSQSKDRGRPASIAPAQSSLLQKPSLRSVSSSSRSRPFCVAGCCSYSASRGRGRA
jgi:hypothetical protein